MKILSLKPGHDGSIVLLNDNQLEFLYEAEKDSFPRYASLDPTTYIKAFSILDTIPDVIAQGGWIKGVHSDKLPLATGYYGFDKTAKEAREVKFLSKNIQFFSSTHERSHIWSGYGMAPFPQGEPCYLLIWEGGIGDFYEIDEKINIKRLGRPLFAPGARYSFLYTLADPNNKGDHNHSSPGKLMALAAFSDRKSMDEEESKLVDRIINAPQKLHKDDLKWSPFYNIGVEHPRLKNLAGKFSDHIFDQFFDFAKKNCTKNYPLIITGGCGLNCEWNTKWKETGLFRDVFIPPVTNDTGSALGTAIDALYHYTGNAKISWNAYSGEEFIHNEGDRALEGFHLKENFSFEEIAKFISNDKVIAWVQGRCEIGPRALGNRSILAAPFKKSIHARLNHIKLREGFRPIAPICLEEDVAKHFDWNAPSPYMLYFQKVKSKELQAITHVDNSARVQTVTKSSNAPLYKLLSAFKQLTGFGVLCNTSLNFNGKGFINNTADLVRYVKSRDLDGFVLGDRFYMKNVHETVEYQR